MKWFTYLTLSLALVALNVTPTFAQRGAGSKAAGEYNFYGGSAGSAMRSARDYSSYYREYVQSAPQQVNPEVAREAADSIGTYIVKAQKHMASMRKIAETHKDSASLASLEVIDKHLADASKSHAEMKDTCLKDHVEGAATLECCKPLYDHLGKAIAEHDKLMKKLASKK